MAKRVVSVRGEWLFCLSTCQWRVLRGVKLIGDDRSEESMQRAAMNLDGQALTGVLVDSRTSACRFEFDLGSVIETRPRPGEETFVLNNTSTEQWLLFEPSGKALSYRSDGICAYSSCCRTHQAVV